MYLLLFSLQLNDVPLDASRQAPQIPSTSFREKKKKKDDNQISLAASKKLRKTKSSNDDIVKFQLQ